MARGTDGNPLVRMDLRVPVKTKEWLQEEAARTNRSMTDILVMALERMKEGKG